MNRADRRTLLAQARHTGHLDQLTPPQREALELWAAGDGYVRIGTRLGIGRDTARDRVRRALRNLSQTSAP